MDDDLNETRIEYNLERFIHFLFGKKFFYKRDVSIFIFKFYEIVVSSI